MNAISIGLAYVLDATRTKVFLVALGFAAVMMGLSFVLGPLSLGTGDRITRDMGLAALILCAALMIMTGGTHLIGREIERKTAFLFLSRPIHRAEYVLGKFVGVTLSAWVMLAITAVVFCAALLVRGDAPDLAILQCAILSALELLVLSAVVVLFATIASPVPAMLYGFGVFVGGHAMAGIFQMGAEVTTGLSRALMNVFHWVIPDLSRFDARLMATHGLAIEWGEIAWALGYGLAYAAAILALACAAFERREFK